MGCPTSKQQITATSQPRSSIDVNCISPRRSNRFKVTPSKPQAPIYFQCQPKDEQQYDLDVLEPSPQKKSQDILLKYYQSQMLQISQSNRKDFTFQQLIEQKKYQLLLEQYQQNEQLQSQGSNGKRKNQFDIGLLSPTRSLKLKKPDEVLRQNRPPSQTRSADQGSRKSSRSKKRAIQLQSIHEVKNDASFSFGLNYSISSSQKISSSSKPKIEQYLQQFQENKSSKRIGQRFKQVKKEEMQSSIAMSILKGQIEEVQFHTDDVTELNGQMRGRSKQSN